MTRLERQMLIKALQAWLRELRRLNKKPRDYIDDDDFEEED